MTRPEYDRRGPRRTTLHVDPRRALLAVIREGGTPEHIVIDWTPDGLRMLDPAPSDVIGERFHAGGPLGEPGDGRDDDA